MVIFELGEVSAKSHPSRAVRSSDISSSADDSALVTSLTNRHGRTVTPPATHPGRVQSSRGRVGPGSVEIDESARLALRITSAFPHPGQTSTQPRSRAGCGQTQSLSHRGQTHPQDANFGLGEDAALPPKTHFPAEGPLFQPSLALNIDPAQVLPTHPPHSVTPSVSPPAQVSFLCP